MDWGAITSSLRERGFATVSSVLDRSSCREIAGWYGEESRFRSHVEMRRYGFGEGDYKYFADPLPEIVAQLRQTLYGNLRGLAEEWRGAYPVPYQSYLDRCRAAGQTKPTCLLLKYEQGGYNRLHQDLYGDLSFPFQMAVLLSQPEQDFTGGEFVLTEQKPRSQSRVQVLRPGQGDAVIFAVNDRPAKGVRGTYTAKMRHGVSEVTSGRRYCLGIIAHLAQ